MQLRHFAVLSDIIKKCCQTGLFFGAMSNTQSQIFIQYLKCSKGVAKCNAVDHNFTSEMIDSANKILIENVRRVVPIYYSYVVSL